MHFHYKQSINIYILRFLEWVFGLRSSFSILPLKDAELNFMWNNEPVLFIYFSTKYNQLIHSTCSTRNQCWKGWLSWNESCVRGIIHYFILLYGSVSQGLGTTKFTNIDIDRGLDFSHLDRHLDRKCFALKWCKLKCKSIEYFLLPIFIYGSTKQHDDKREDDEQTLTELSSAHRHSSPFASKMSVSTNQLH